jgi:hypothetical protein
MADDIEIFLDSNGQNRRKVSPRRFEMMPEIVHQELVKAGTSIGKRLLKDLRMAYALAIRERPRKEGETLKKRLAQALTMEVVQTPQEVAIGIFDLFTIDELTRNEGKGTEQQGWFFLYEDGHEGLAHGSARYAFVELEAAIRLAKECAQWAEMKADKEAEFLAYVKDVFQGRHGDGIMTRLDKPLFYEFPDFGTPEEKGFHPHTGLEAWNILYTHGSLDDARKNTRYSVGGQAVGTHWALQEFEKAFDRAKQRVTI